jgi:protein involved in polysaccharide export with SLBB domain
MTLRMLFLSCLMIVAAAVSSQERSAPAAAQDRALEATERVQIALSSLEYPVTPGDIYLLSYRPAGGDVVTKSLIVNGDYSIDFGIFGKVAASNLTFADLKAKAESIVMESYTRSLPSLTISTTGVFRLGIRGEIARVDSPTAWGLTRLSEVVDAVRGPNASYRIVEVTSKDGSLKRYDLLKARRLGMVDQDPLLKPGDIVALRLALRIVRLEGEVWQPGSYELAPDEGLRELIDIFGGGLTSRADLMRVRVDHVTASGLRSDYLALPQAYDAGALLQHGDVVSIGSRSDRRPVVWFEGAVVQAAAARQASGPDSAAGPEDGDEALAGGRPAREDEAARGRVSCRINEGEMLSDALAEMRNNIAPNADLASAVLIRQDRADPVAVDLQALLGGKSAGVDLPLTANDRIFIPLLQSTVSVTGAVNNAGNYPYQPGMPAWYYIGLAGGIDQERSKKGSFRVMDQRGNRRLPADQIKPGDQIYVASTAFEYNIMRYSPLITGIATTIVSIITLALTIVNLN